MSNFDKSQLVNSFSSLGEKLINPDEEFLAIIENEQYHNAWFTPASVTNAVTAAGKMLYADDLIQWLDRYKLKSANRKVGLILAGNIPLVGLHDVLSVLISGNYALIKASAQDARLIKYVLDLLTAIEPAYKDKYSFVDRLENFDAIIATGSNNTSRYFEYYFGRVPHIIRKNRNSVALITGNETTEQLNKLGIDFFSYYGLGCRNVSKLLVPQDYNFIPFFEAIESYQPVINHHKYNNNYDYNKSIYLVNRDKHYDNGFLLVKEDDRMVSPLAVLYYQQYQNPDEALNLLKTQEDQIQCIVSNLPLSVNNQIVGFGESQHPRLWDYADGVDTMQFLINL